MTNHGITIRAVTLDDAAALQANCLPMKSLAKVQAGIAEHPAPAADGTRVHLVAEAGGEAIGNAVLQRHAHPLMAHRAEVCSLVVAEGYQRQGVARRRVEAACECAREMGVEILEVSCRGGEPAEQVYPRLGFREYGRLPRGIVEPWGDKRVFDQVYFFMPVTP